MTEITISVPKITDYEGIDDWYCGLFDATGVDDHSHPDPIFEIENGTFASVIERVAQMVAVHPEKQLRLVLERIM